METNNVNDSNGTGAEAYTYYDERSCEFCNKPIPDQEHATRKFCPKSYDNFGKVKDCKTAFHRLKDQPEREVQSSIINYHKTVAERIDMMVKKKGSLVNTEDLNAYEIQLCSPISYQLKSNGEFISEFLQHTIISNLKTFTHKIIRHE